MIVQCSVAYSAHCIPPPLRSRSSPVRLRRQRGVKQLWHTIGRGKRNQTTFDWTLFGLVPRVSVLPWFFARSQLMSSGAKPSIQKDRSPATSSKLETSLTAESVGFVVVMLIHHTCWGEISLVVALMLKSTHCRLLGMSSSDAETYRKLVRRNISLVVILLVRNRLWGIAIPEDVVAFSSLARLSGEGHSFPACSSFFF